MQRVKEFIEKQIIDLEEFFVVMMTDISEFDFMRVC